jgi:hypothetical protein
MKRTAQCQSTRRSIACDQATEALLIHSCSLAEGEVCSRFSPHRQWLGLALGAFMPGRERVTAIGNILDLVITAVIRLGKVGRWTHNHISRHFRMNVAEKRHHSGLRERERTFLTFRPGSGLIGSRLVNKLREKGHDAIAAAPNTGVNTITGEGLAGVLKGASVVVDVSNSPSWDDAAVMKFFETSTRNLLTYEAVAGVKHHVALSVVGTQLLAESGYFRAKIAQENLIKESSIPFSIVHATQFFEFLKGLADISMIDGKVHLPNVLFQPMAAEDVATGVAKIAVAPPVNGIIEIGGPEQFRVDELVRRRRGMLVTYRVFHGWNKRIGVESPNSRKK